MSTSGLSSVVNGIVNSITNFFGILVQSIEQVLSFNADSIAVIAGVGVIVAMFTGVLDKVPIIGDFLQKIGL